MGSGVLYGLGSECHPTSGLGFQGSGSHYQPPSPDRGLKFMLVLLQSISDGERDDEHPNLIRVNAMKAYEIALKKYHGWMLQKLFMVRAGGDFFCGVFHGVMKSLKLGSTSKITKSDHRPIPTLPVSLRRYLQGMLLLMGSSWCGVGRGTWGSHWVLGIPAARAQLCSHPIPQGSVYALPYKSDLLKALEKGKEVKEEESIEKIHQFLTRVTPILDAIYEMYTRMNAELSYKA